MLCTHVRHRDIDDVWAHECGRYVSGQPRCARRCMCARRHFSCPPRLCVDHPIVSSLVGDYIAPGLSFAQVLLSAYPSPLQRLIIICCCGDALHTYLRHRHRRRMGTRVRSLRLGSTAVRAAVHACARGGGTSHVRHDCVLIALLLSIVSCCCCAISPYV